MDHYRTLGVEKNATPDEIKKAYRKLAGQHHPDKGGDTNTFQKIQVAYDTLSDPEKRRQYDNPMPQGFQGFNNGFNFSTNHYDLNEIFNQMFGQRQGQSHSQTYRTNVNITLENAYYGVSHTLKLNTPNGTKVINIEIPKGISNGNQMKYDKVFDNSSTLIVEFRIVPNLRFERRNNDLISNIQVSVLDLIVGGTIEFTTISGKTLEVAIPPKTQPNMQLKIAGQGMPIINSSLYGDQILLIKPFVPAIIDPRISESILQAKTK